MVWMPRTGVDIEGDVEEHHGCIFGVGRKKLAVYLFGSEQEPVTFKELTESRCSEMELVFYNSGGDVNKGKKFPFVDKRLANEEIARLKKENNRLENKRKLLDDMNKHRLKEEANHHFIRRVNGDKIISLKEML